MKYNQFKNEFHSGCISIYNGDCMDLLKQTPDKYYSLALVDPPYGLGKRLAHASKDKKNSQSKFTDDFYKKNWDNEVPSKEYFDELFRVSKNQIIWGGNYFPLKPTQCFYIWDKKQPHDFSLAMCEMAWTSFSKPAKICRLSVLKEKNKIHATQKPIALYDWIIKNYAKPGDKILDTHLGSGSIAIAIEKANRINGMGLQFTGIELDEEYYNAALQRFKIFTMQQTIIW